MKRLFKQAVLNSADGLGLLSIAQRLGAGAGQSIYVVVHHRVGYPADFPNLNPELINSTPEQLDYQFRMIARHYAPVSAEDVLEAIAGGRRLPSQAVLVTVDDGYRDFKDIIWPTAKRHGIRPVLFVPTGYVGRGGFWWDRVYNALRQTQGLAIQTPFGELSIRDAQEKRLAVRQIDAYIKRTKPFTQAVRLVDDLCRSLQVDLPAEDHSTLDWDELRQLAREGATLAPHTHSHPALGNIPVEDARREMAESMNLLNQEIGPTLPIFAYPYGSPPTLSSAVGETAKDLGIKLAFTMSLGRANLRRDDPLWLPRLPAAVSYSSGQTRAQLTPFYDRVRRWQLSRRRQA